MPDVAPAGDRDRLKAVAGAAVLHALLGYALLTGLASKVAVDAGTALKTFDIVDAQPPPPLPEPVPPKERAPEAEGAAAPPGLRAKPSPVVAPPPRIRLKVPPPVAAAPVPTPLPPGNDNKAGAADVAGPGWGSGGVGAGTGSGARGSGGGGGGAAMRARRISGAISGDRDYPSAARRAGIQGSVLVRFSVGSDGTVSDCVVTRSSAGPELAAATCRLIEARFRYEPARDAEGKPVRDTVSRTFDWLLPPGRR